MPPTRDVVIRRNGGVPVIELFFGRANWAKFQVSVWDTQGGPNPDVVVEATNTATTPFRYGLDTDKNGKDLIHNDLGALAERILGWYVAVASFTGGSGETYVVRVTVTQDGQTLDTFPYNGKFDDGTLPLFESVRLKVQ